MLLTSGIIALSRKIADEKAKKQEARQGHLRVGDSDVAKRAFAAQTSKMIEPGSAGIDPTGTDIEYEDPNEVIASSPDATSPGIYSPKVEIQDARSASQVDVTSPVKSEKGFLGMTSPDGEIPAAPAVSLQQNSIGGSSQPPPYSPGPESSNSPQLQSPHSPRPESLATARSPSVYSRDVDSNTAGFSDTKSISTRSTNSVGTHAIRVKTKGGDLKSGFPYHPALFDLHVHPAKWESFTYQIVESTKFETRDYARVIGAATATAMTGAIGTSIWVGRTMNRSVQENKVRAGLADMSDGGLGDTLKSWNENYFSRQGLFVHMELSESAMKKPGQRSRTFRKPVSFYSNKNERARKEEERKFVIVVTKLDKDGQPTEAMHELAAADTGPVELGNGGDVSSSIPELPADEGAVPVELPADSAYSAEKKIDPPAGYVEMDSDNTRLLGKIDPPTGYVEMDSDNSHLLEKTHLDDRSASSPTDSEQGLVPKPLAVTPGSQTSFNPRTT